MSGRQDQAAFNRIGEVCAVGRGDRADVGCIEQMSAGQRGEVGREEDAGFQFLENRPIAPIHGKFRVRRTVPYSPLFKASGFEARRSPSLTAVYAPEQ